MPPTPLSHNLFRLLAPEYDVTIHEAVTRFCASPEYRCPDAARVQQRGHLSKRSPGSTCSRIAPNSAVMNFQADDLRTEQQRFQEFLGEIAAPSGSRPRFEFMLSWSFRMPLICCGPMAPSMKNSPGGFDPTFAGSTRLLQYLRDNYELQVQYVDGELGRFVDQLKQAGLYDRSLIVVTSDHGVSWKTEAPGRVLSAANAEMIFPVPLFIKLPGQSEGKVSGQDAQVDSDLIDQIAARHWRSAFRRHRGTRSSFGLPGEPCA